MLVIWSIGYFMANKRHLRVNFYDSCYIFVTWQIPTLPLTTFLSFRSQNNTNHSETNQILSTDIGFKILYDQHYKLKDNPILFRLIERKFK